MLYQRNIINQEAEKIFGYQAYTQIIYISNVATSSVIPLSQNFIRNPCFIMHIVGGGEGGGDSKFPEILQKEIVWGQLLWFYHPGQQSVILIEGGGFSTDFIQPGDLVKTGILPSQFISPFTTNSLDGN